MISDADFDYLHKFRKILIEKHKKKSESELFSDSTCMKEYKLELRKVQSHIPTKYRSFTFSDVTHPQLKIAKDYALDYLKNLETNKNSGIAPLMCGPSGTGKTLLGCLVLMEVLKSGYSAYFTKVDQCIDLLTSSWYDEVVKQEFNEQILSVDFLMIDDAGDELRSLTSNLVESTLNKVLRIRADNLRPTILTTNLQVKDLKTIYDHRIYSILKEHALIIPCSGPDYREKIIAPSINPK